MSSNRKFDTCFFERYAQITLETCLGPHYASLVNEDRPDLQMPDLVYNPTDKNWGDRTPLLLAVSKDNGDSWENILTFEEAEVGREEDVEYSYPAITAHNGKLHITYTYNRVSIVYWEVEIK